MNITVQSLDKKTSTKARDSKTGKFLDFWNVVGHDDKGVNIRYTCWQPAILNKLNCTLELGKDYTIEDKGNGYIKMNLTDSAKAIPTTTGGTTTSGGGKTDYAQMDSERLKTMFTSYAKDLVIAVYNNVKPKASKEDLSSELFGDLLLCQKAIVDTADLMLLAITGKPKDEALGVPTEDTELEPF
jgi:hypothetical protein